ncbi:hypothetical protein M8818_002190 [Zalaria obscura]|uniref:Uncharacterized protein n=1 Tax=Zalaria obscura TaxID=2024903 RepID=A0ACC3SK58_9PEZI
MRPSPSSHGAHQQQNRRRRPPIPLHILPNPGRKKARIREQIAVITRQHDTSQAAILQDSTGDSLATALERDDAERDEDLPVQTLAGVSTERDDERGNQDAEELEQKGGDEDPAAAGGEEAVVAAEEEGAEAEGEDAEAGFYPAVAAVRVDEAEA